MERLWRWHASVLLALLIDTDALRLEQPDEVQGNSCDRTVSFLFLTRDDLPVDKVWRKFLDGCDKGSYTVSIHSQTQRHSFWLPDAHVLADPVQGNLRLNYTMQMAMNRLYRDALGATAPNGCRPRWAQLLSESCAPLQSCQDYQQFLAAHRGASLLEYWPCTVGATADACYCRKPGQWRRPWYKAHQWSTLWMEHVQQLLEKEEANEKLWRKVPVVDEHYNVNILDSLGANLSAFGLTHVYPFLPGMKGHPQTTACGADRLSRGQVSFSQCVEDVKGGGRFFSRKFGPSCVDDLLANLK